MVKKLDALIEKVVFARCDSCYSDKNIEMVTLNSTGKAFKICNDCKHELGKRFTKE